MASLPTLTLPAHFLHAFWGLLRPRARSSWLRALLCTCPNTRIRQSPGTGAAGRPEPGPQCSACSSLEAAGETLGQGRPSPHCSPPLLRAAGPLHLRLDCYKSALIVSLQVLRMVNRTVHSQPLPHGPSWGGGRGGALDSSATQSGEGRLLSCPGQLWAMPPEGAPCAEAAQARSLGARPAQCGLGKGICPWVSGKAHPRPSLQ